MRTETYRLAAYLIALLLFVPFLTGCAGLNTRTLSSPEKLTHTETRIFCSLQGDEASVFSRWGLLSFAFDVSQRDARAICAPTTPTPSVDILLPDLGAGSKAR